MSEGDALDLTRRAVWTVLAASAPAVATAMVVGVAIALVQALTQVQEITLTFVPKIIGVMIALAVGAPFLGGQILLLTEQLYARVETGF